MTTSIQPDHVWAVIYGDHSPSEVDSLWSTAYGAQQRKDKLAGSAAWRIARWDIKHAAPAEEPHHLAARSRADDEVGPWFGGNASTTPCACVSDEPGAL